MKNGSLFFKHSKEKQKKKSIWAKRAPNLALLSAEVGVGKDKLRPVEILPVNNNEGMRTTNTMNYGGVVTWMKKQS